MVNPPIRGLFPKLFSALLVALLCTLLVAGVPLSRSTVWQPVLVALLMSWLLSRWIVRPVQRSLGRTIHQISDQLQQGVQELQSQRNQAQAILDSMVEAVVALDREGGVLWLNGSAQRLFEVTTDQARGKRLLEVFRQPALDELVREGLASRQPTVREVRVFSPREAMIRFQVAPCEGGEQGATLVLVAQDVTEVRRLEQMRREFVGNVSHELKTPLTSIRGLVETLLSGALEDPANNRRFVTLIDEDATRLSRLIDDLLQLSEIESKAVPLRLERVNIAVLLDDIQTSFGQRMKERRLACEIEIPPDTPAVQADPDRLRQVFVNLLDNAIKFTPEGGRIRLSARPRGPMLDISVSDTGVGIPEQDLPRIFERFYRVDKARSRELGGTGLGLSIVKHIVEAHGGTVSVVSRAQQGATFTVSLSSTSA